jgi:hypothetical protein
MKINVSTIFLGLLLTLQKYIFWYSGSWRNWFRILFNFCEVESTSWLYHSPLASCSQIRKQAQINHSGIYTHARVIWEVNEVGKKCWQYLRRQASHSTRTAQFVPMLSCYETIHKNLALLIQEFKSLSLPAQQGTTEARRYGLPPFVGNENVTPSCSWDITGVRH